MSNKKPNKRHSAPGAAAWSASMMPLGPMPMPGSSAFSQQPKPSPWDTDSDKDFQPGGGGQEKGQDKTKKCIMCKREKGQCALKPCGHGLFCFMCLNNHRLQFISAQTPVICPTDGCQLKVHGMLLLNNVNV